MQTKETRKEIIQKYKERKPSLGTFAVRCTATGGVWVGSSRNLQASKNGAWFTLRLGTHPTKSLQEEWNIQGEAAFEYEILDTLDEDVLALAAADLLKEKRKHWMAVLGTQPLL